MRIILHKCKKISKYINNNNNNNINTQEIERMIWIKSQNYEIFLHPWKFHNLQSDFLRIFNEIINQLDTLQILLFNDYSQVARKYSYKQQ